MEWEGGCGEDGHHGPSPRPPCFPAASSDGTTNTCAPEGGVSGELIAVAFLDEQRLVVQRREPAELVFVDARAPQQLVTASTLRLSPVAMADTGHTIFHANTGSGVACASCHPEGHEDGQTWDFLCQGTRRTQDIGGQLAGTEPFHWSGDLGDFTALMNDVFVGRMSGPSLSPDQLMAVRRWVDSVPLRPALRSAGDPAVVRGKALFEDATVGCAGCHNGPALTNNMSMAVGTGAPFQVPSLRGVGWRAPLMHDGCAPTLDARFGAASCSGGDAHGHTSHLDAAQITDVVAYLESL
jgi:mono/diheme cytochrome c family protein